MVTSVAARRSLLLLGAVFGLSGAVLAQIPPRIKQCLPYPTFLEGVRQDLGAAAPVPIRVRVMPEVVEVRGATKLPLSAQDEVVEGLKRRVYFADSDWKAEMESHIRGAWQDQGYFRAKVAMEANELGLVDATLRIKVTALIEEGAQYRLKEMRFRAEGDRESVFPVDILRRQFRMEDFDVFDVSKVREGLENLQRLYSARGYIDSSAGPDVTIDQEQRLIILTLGLYEGTQFSLGTVEVLGVREPWKSQIKARLRAAGTGGLAGTSKILKDFAAVLPADASAADLAVSRDLQKGLVHLTLDVRSCLDPATR